MHNLAHGLDHQSQKSYLRRAIIFARRKMWGDIFTDTYPVTFIRPLGTQQQ